jgi:hypothetical protein
LIQRRKTFPNHQLHKSTYGGHFWHHLCVTSLTTNAAAQIETAEEIGRTKLDESSQEITMRKIAFCATLILAAGVVLAMTDAQAEASNGSHFSSGSHQHYGSSMKFSHQGHSYSFHGYPSSYRSWSSYCYFPSYRCYGYYCPTQCCWYYYYPQQSCYVPVQYIGQLPPTVNQNTSQNTNQNVNVNTNIVNSNGTPALPPGATPLPVGTQAPQ